MKIWWYFFIFIFMNFIFFHGLLWFEKLTLPNEMSRLMWSVEVAFHLHREKPTKWQFNEFHKFQQLLIAIWFNFYDQFWCNYLMLPITASFADFIIIIFFCFYVRKTLIFVFSLPFARTDVVKLAVKLLLVEVFCFALNLSLRSFSRTIQDSV